jgi:DNA helicase HerA-like ATPase
MTAMTTDDRRRAIGKVVSVAADRLVVELHGGTANFTVVGFDDVHYVARLGSFVVMPTQAEYVVAEVVGLREKDAPSSRSAQGESTELDKAGSAKYLDLVPVGMLPQRRDGAFRFGVSTFPSLYADALYVLDEELDRIFEVQSATEIVPLPVGNNKATRYNALSIGTSVVFKDYAVKVRVDEFFGGHSAVLGNTGSGKSCTVATLLQSLFEKRDEFFALGATFLLLDVNGEYRSAFAELPNSVKRRYVKLEADPTSPANPPADEAETTAVFRLPHWFMTVEEWELLLRASERTQQPVLRSALGLVTMFSPEAHEAGGLEKLKNHILAKCLLFVLNSADSPAAKGDRVKALLATFQTTTLTLKELGPLANVTYGEMKQLQPLMEKLTAQLNDEAKIPNYSNRSFRFEDLEQALDLALLYEEAHGNMQIRDYCSQMITRFKWIRERDEFAFLRVPPEKLEDHERDVKQFVERCLGLSRLDSRFQKSAQVIVLDMNDAGDEVVEVASAVIARLIFDRLRRAQPRNRTPINLVLEEAHRYVAEKPTGYAIDASRIFQRIAKEGRKYGLFLMVASQRPSELSRTVLSQCSNFVVHRIQNPDDLQHIRQMTPFVSDSVMKRLPSLPKQHALIFGNAVNLPTTFKVRDVKPKPMSDDAAIRDLWFRPNGKEVELKLPQ